MSASLYWQPVKGRHLSIGTPSSFLAMVERVLERSPPWTILDVDAGRLTAAAAAIEVLDQRAALLALAEAAMEYGEIRLWAEY